MELFRGEQREAGASGTQIEPRLRAENGKRPRASAIHPRQNFIESQEGIRSRSGTQPCGTAVSYSRGTLAGSTLRKISHTPPRTSAPPTSDQIENVSPPSSQPKITAPGGVISEM